MTDPRPKIPSGALYRDKEANMIVFDLECANGHVFEGWFEDNNAYDRQREASLVACPVCNDTGIRKRPSAFAIKSARRPRGENKPQTPSDRLHKSLLEYVDRHFENVGTDFATEALKIHYGVAEPRNIRGSSTEKEEETLRQEGISFVKLPGPPPSEPET